MKCLLVILLFFGVASLAAQSPPAVESTLLLPTAAPEPWVGQKMVLNVKLRVPTHFSGTAAFDLPQVSGALILQEPGSPVLDSETIGNQQYVVQEHEILIYPQRAGEVVVPAFSARFNAAGLPGQPETPMSGQTSEVRFTAKLPPGAEGLANVITTTEFKVSEQWKPAPGQISPKVGDAFTRVITITAADVPGMVLPPAPTEALDGLRAFAKPPLVNDKSNRGDLSGERVDTLSYLCTSPGTVSLPALTYVWWDAKAQQLHRETLPAVSFSIAAVPEPPPAPNYGRIALFWGIGLLAVVVPGVWLIRRLPAWLAARRESEPVRFRQLLAACQANQAAIALRAYYQWREILPSAPTPRLLRDLERASYFPDTPWTGAPLADELRTLRQSVLQTRHHREALATALPPINP